MAALRHSRTTSSHIARTHTHEHTHTHFSTQHVGSFFSIMRVPLLNTLIFWKTYIQINIGSGDHHRSTRLPISCPLTSDRMNSIGKIGSLALANGRECAGRTSDRIVPGNNGKITPRDHPMLQTNDQSNEVKKTQHSYKEPRIDQRMYQADIPLLQGRASNRAVTRGSSSPRAGENYTTKFRPLVQNSPLPSNPTKCIRDRCAVVPVMLVFNFVSLRRVHRKRIPAHDTADT